MKVIKRDGSIEPIKFDKISARIKKQTYGLNTDYVDFMEVTQKVIAGIYDGITTRELDDLASKTAASLTRVHPDYSKLASRLAISSLKKYTKKSFVETIEDLYNYINPNTGEPAGLISDNVYEVVKKHGKKLDHMIVHDKDFNFDFFGFKTLERAYLLKMKGEIAETPQHMYLRVAIGIWGDNLKEVQKTYDSLSNGLFTHATPTLFNAGTKKPQLSSCFLVAMEDDSIKGIYNTLSDCADISQSAGGIGMHIHNIRAKGTYIKGTNGTSNGIIPMLKVYNETARYVDQGGGKRKGSIAVYLEPWHADIRDFINLRKNHGKEEMRARDLFLALWTPDLFMQRVQEDGDWTLMCPHDCPGLSDVYDSEDNKAFTELYTKYERELREKYADEEVYKVYRKNRFIKARELYAEIIEAQIETGTPYMLYKDAANRKSNQKNIGTIKSSNLCTEIMEVSTPDETAVCNLASIALPKFVTIPSGKVKSKNKALRTFDHQALYDISYQATVNLNKVIDINWYPTEKTKKSNMRHRPIGLGVQGLADTFAMLGYAFESEEAIKLNKEIFETIYFAAMTASKDLAKKEGAYETFEGSPASQGIFQYDMWEITEDDLSGRWNWEALKKAVVKHGVRNSLLMAPMPTASTAQILGNNECFEPYTTNIYKRNVLAGEYVIINKHLIEDLINLGLWDDEMRIALIKSKGSIQDIDRIPSDIKDIYKTVWEMKSSTLLKMVRDRGLFICQSQSMNLFMRDANTAKLSKALMYGWKLGLKTGMYYLRTNSNIDAKQSLGADVQNKEEKVETVTPKVEETTTVSVNLSAEEEALKGVTCSIDNPDDCQMCGS